MSAAQDLACLRENTRKNEKYLAIGDELLGREE